MNKNIIRIFLIFLVICTVAGCFSGCETAPQIKGETTESNTTTTDSPPASDAVTLNGVPLEEYMVVYARSDTKFESKVADQVRSALQDAFKIRLKVRIETAEISQKAIVVGSLEKAEITNTTESIEDGEWCLTADADRVYLLSKTEYGYQEALKALIAALEAAKESRAIIVSANTKKNYEEKRMTTMTFNIRNWDKSEGHLYRIKQTIKTYTPDTIGFQEMSNRAGYEWVNKLLADPEISNMYAYIGKDRGDATGEECAIFYRKDTFTEVEHGTRWLYCPHGIHCTSTACKGEVIPGRFGGNTFSNSEHYRIMTYARLKRISDGKELVFINTHLETWGELQDGQQIQTKQIDYVLNFAKELIDKGETVVLTGDFNSYIDSPTNVKIPKIGFLCAESESKRLIGEELKGGEMYLSEHKEMFGRLDHIFISSPGCCLESYTYCNQKIEYNGVEDYASDHIPRIATYTLA